MRHLILVKHSLPAIDPTLPAEQWRLSDEGRRRCARLADHLAAYRLVAVVASVEPKAEETARLVAERLDLAYTTAEGLHEHDRSNVGWSSTDAFEAQVAWFFAHPAELVMGRETADLARARFTQAVNTVLETRPSGDLAIVAHGTVITLFVAAHNGLAPFPFWRRLGLPSFVVLAPPEMTIIETGEQVL
jgi:broad specificity phosphatase PhoE